MMATITLALPTNATIVTRQADPHAHNRMSSRRTSSQAATKVPVLRAGEMHVLELKAPRVGHKKSRKGCAQCKRRHVKCNEESPCSNCTRHHVPCSLAGGPFIAREDSKNKDHRTQSNASSAEATASLARRSPLDGDSTLPLLKIVESSSMSPTGMDPQQREMRISPISPGLSMLPSPVEPLASLTAHVPRSPASPGLINWHLDMQLMHHYMSYTKGVLSEASDQAYIVHVWKQELPKLAFANEYVLHALLGVVALHKATVTPDQVSYFRTCAVEHIDLAEMQFHQHSGQTCTVEAASARWVYRWLIFLFALGIMQSGVAVPSGLDGLTNVMMLARGTERSADDDWYLISQGAFAPVLSRGWQDVAPGFALVLEGMDLGLSHLEYMLGVEAMLPHERAACALAIDDLRRIHRDLLVQPEAPQQQQHPRGAGWGCSVASFICWPRRESSVFANMIRRRAPQALVVVSYHCLLLHALEAKWWARAWGVRLLQDVLLHLDEAWKSWVQWPVQAIM